MKKKRGKILFAVIIDWQIVRNEFDPLTNLIPPVALANKDQECFSIRDLLSLMSLSIVRLRILSSWDVLLLMLKCWVEVDSFGCSCLFRWISNHIMKEKYTFWYCWIITFRFRTTSFKWEFSSSNWCNLDSDSS